MKVIHSSAWYFPDSTGGTEVYVDALARELQQVGIQNVVVASRDANGSEDYSYGGIPIHRYPFQQPVTKEHLRGDKAPGGFEEFENWLENERGDIYHQHSWTLGCGLFHLKAAKRKKLSTVLTVHLPNIICSRGTMMLFGREACDGYIEEGRCSACWMESRGLPNILGTALSKTPQIFHDLFGSCLSGKLETLFSMKRLIGNKRLQLDEMITQADKIIVVSRWLHNALLMNGVPASKLVICRHGYPEELKRGEDQPLRRSSKDLEVGYIGRWGPAKGIDLIVEAFKKIPADIPIKLKIYAIGDGIEEKRYRDKLAPLIADDGRIRVENPLSRSEVIPAMLSLDVLVVPSQVLETGPYVVLEALVAEVPVIGADLGGIAEWVEHGVNGLLLPFDQPEIWRDTLMRFALNRSELQKFRFDRPVRSMKDVAREMKDLYNQLAKSN
jgi:glycosyltransferase involved in cell wall biosynthesis